MKLIIFLAIAMLVTSKYTSFNPSGPSKQHKKFVTHPQSVSNRWGSSINFPYPTNSWFQNFVLGSQKSPVNLYSVYVAAHQDSFKISSNNNLILEEKFIAAAFVEDWSFSTVEGMSNSKVTFYNELTVHLDYNNKVQFPLVYGMPFLTAIVNGQTPKLDTIHAIMQVQTDMSETLYTSGDQFEAAQYFTIYLNNGQYWFVSVDVPVQVQIHGSSVRFSSPIKGAVRVGCMGDTNKIDQIKNYLGTYPTKGNVDYTLTQSSYTLTYTYESNNNGDLLMMALPHHINLLQNAKKVSFTQKTIKGTATGIVGNQWVLKDKLQGIAWDAAHGIDSDKIETIRHSLKIDAQKTLPNYQTDDPYWYGLRIAKFARLVLIAEQIGETQLAYELRQKIKNSIIVWLTGKNGDPLFYDTTHGGVCSAHGLADQGADFGQGYYNDHYFHYGYHVYTLAVIIKGDKAFYTQYKNEILDYVQDYANPDPNDSFFTLARHKDWFVGHSWAAGLFEFFDNRNQESSSEAVNAYYAVYLLGLATGNTEMERYGNLLMSMEIQAVQHYWQMPSNSEVYPQSFRKHKMVGMVWGSKAQYGTWFGEQEIFVHGINFLPFTPISEALLKKEYVQEEYPVLIAGKQNSEWECYEISDQAIINKTSAWGRALKLTQLHDGMSMTNLLYWIATRY